MNFLTIITLYFSIILLIRVQGAPQEVLISTTNLDNDSDNVKEPLVIADTSAGGSKLEELSSEEITDDSKISSSEEVKDTTSQESSMEAAVVQIMKEEQTRELEANEEENNTEDLNLLQATTSTLQDIENSINNENDKEEALRNERDLKQALDKEKELLRLAKSDESCRDKKCEKCDNNDNNLKCHNETAVTLCTPAGIERIIRCTGLTPMCHPTLNVCTSRRLLNSDITAAVESDNSPTIICPSYNAYYPDLNTCRKFYYCISGKPYQYKCADNEVYNPLTKACALQTLTTPCRRFHCEGKNGRYAAYPGDPSVYAVCSDNRAVNMLHCPQGEAMHEENQKCQTHCRKEGLITDHSSCTHYYECTSALPMIANNARRNQYKITRRSCPPNMVFYPAMAFCVPQHQYMSCKEKQQQHRPATTTRPHQPTTPFKLSEHGHGQTVTTSYTTFTPDGNTYTTIPVESTTMQYVY